MDRLFRRADILLPRGCDMAKWSVVACDQFSAQPEYWEALERQTAGVPSTLHLVLPEAYLSGRDTGAAAETIGAEMRGYMERGLFETFRDSFVYVERSLPSGALRRGLVGVIDLEGYDYAPDSASPIRATEGTVEQRLPPRVLVRERAPLELTHAMVFIDDPENSVLGPLTGARASLPALYDFPLCAGGGHIRGWRVSGPEAGRVDAALDALCAARSRGSAAPILFAMGDGNHSIAAAKRCWESRKAALPPRARERDPARWALVELVNLHDPAIVFEPIHRALLGTDPAAFLREAREVFAERYRPGGQTYALRAVTAEAEALLTVPADSIGALIAAAEAFCQDCAARFGGSVDYIHNDEAALALGRRPGGAALLLPRMEKGELFPSVARSGPFPKKSFSIGRAEEKRYYLECRKIIDETASY
ncbi:MAG: DUF1015 domain-containing protein [Oscillospiraceae bacterium]|nr:DUF1015 domain-containing protein [Oscillospiraceae bacterium]